VGAGHSFSDATFASGVLLRTLALDRPLALDRSRLKAKHRSESLFHVEGGIRLRTLNGILDPQGLALPNMGGWDLQTIAGVISTSTHGSGLGYGPYPSFVASLVMVTAGGRVVQFEPTDGITDPQAFQGVVETPCGPHPAILVQDDGAFRAALVNMGTMGVTYSVVIRVVPSFWLHEAREVTTWEAVIAPGGFLNALLSEGQPRPAWKGLVPDFYELLVNPYVANGTHTCVITRRTKCDPNPHRSRDCETRGKWWFNVDENIGLAAPYVVPDIINDEPEKAGTYIDKGMNGASDDCFEGHSYDVFNAGIVNELPAYSVDLGIDLSKSVAAVQRVLDLSVELQSLRIGVHSAPLSLRFVAPCEAYLSPQHAREATCMIEIFALLGVPGTEAMLLQHEHDLMEKFCARPHWGLDLRAIQGKESLLRTYPDAAEWQKHYARYNATGVFNSELTDRLGVSVLLDNRGSEASHRCIPLP
jgi:hypothetical protein